MLVGKAFHSLGPWTANLLSEREESEEEESEEEGGFEEVENQPQQASQGACCHLSGTLGVVRGWVEEETFNDISEDKERDMASLVSNLV